MTETTIKANSMKELTELFSNLKKIAETWCNNHKNYEYEIRINHTELTINLKINKL